MYVYNIYVYILYICTYACIYVCVTCTNHQMTENSGVTGWVQVICMGTGTDEYANQLRNAAGVCVCV